MEHRQYHVQVLLQVGSKSIWIRHREKRDGPPYVFATRQDAEQFIANQRDPKNYRIEHYQAGKR